MGIPRVYNRARLALRDPSIAVPVGHRARTSAPDQRPARRHVAHSTLELDKIAIIAVAERLSSPRPSSRSMHDHKSPTQDSHIPECTIMQTTTIMHIRNLPPGSRAPTGARSRHQTPCSHWSMLTSPEISHPGAVLPPEHAHVCACAAARTAEMCE